MYKIVYKIRMIEFGQETRLRLRIHFCAKERIKIDRGSDRSMVDSVLPQGYIEVRNRTRQWRRTLRKKKKGIGDYIEDEYKF